MARVTQQDVADEVGLTRATVSYVLGGRSEVHAIPEATRLRSLEAARSLKTNRTMTLAMVVPDLGNPFYPMQIKGAQRAAQEAGYRLIVVDSDGSLEGEHLEELKAAGIPCVGPMDRLRSAPPCLPGLCRRPTSAGTGPTADTTRRLSSWSSKNMS